MKKILIIALIITTSLFAQTQYSEIAGMAGAFSRMGFGARGIGMGNSMSAVKEGNLVSYYNPALVVFQNGNSFQTSYSFLSLDRKLNFINFTRRFEFGKKEMQDGTIKPRSIAGVSIGLINSGVTNIDGRDGQGNKIGNYSTSENQFFVAVANKFSEKFSLGISFKFYYYKLFENLSANGFGLDIGGLYSLNDVMAVSLTITDLNSKYSWDSGKIFGTNGTIGVDKFPLIKKVGFSYKFENEKLLTAIELENSNAKTNYLRFGAEYNPFENIFFRAGIDRLNLSNTKIPIRPSFGLSYFYVIKNYTFGFDYAFVVEPYSSSDQHIIGLNFRL